MDDLFPVNINNWTSRMLVWLVDLR